MTTEKTYNVLVLCTGNSARSIMAEALINTMGRGRFTAYSAGSNPGGTVNPFAIERIQVLDYPTDKLRSKSWDEFAAPDAPQMDFIITVCDNAAGEVCPVWPGQPVTAHWGVYDPAAVTGTPAQQLHAFEEVAQILKRRIDLMLSLPAEKLASLSIQADLNAIGKL